jgi:hypothetical protein
VSTGTSSGGVTSGTTSGASSGASAGTTSGTTSGGDAAAGGSSSGAPPPAGVNVLEHHLHPQRDGAYVDAAITKAATAKLVLDTGFKGAITGTVWGQPLFVDGLGVKPDMVIVATGENHVTALNATSGAVIWDQTLGPPVSQPNLMSCGIGIPVYGVTATPYIDLANRIVYVESLQQPAGQAITHRAFALSLDTGMTETGWPVDIPMNVPGFVANYQHDRGAITALGGVLYIPYSGMNNDCDPMNAFYYGYVVGIDTTTRVVTAYKPVAPEGSIWGSIASDGVSSVFAVSGNSKHPGQMWGGQEALLRFSAGPVFSKAATDYFTPSNWHGLDNVDGDLGSSAPVLFDMPGAAQHGQLAVVGGKGGIAHLLDRANLGGIGTGNGTAGEGLYSLRVTNGWLLGTKASYTSSLARYVVLWSNQGMTGCPTGFGNLMALKVTLTPSPTLTPVWCANENGGGQGSPIATTTDGTSNALVWVVGNNVLQAFDGDTGAPVFTGPGGQLNGVQKWTSPIVAKGRFIIAGSGNVYAYKLP